MQDQANVFTPLSSGNFQNIHVCSNLQGLVAEDVDYCLTETVNIYLEWCSRHLSCCEETARAPSDAAAL